MCTTCKTTNARREETSPEPTAISRDPGESDIAEVVRGNLLRLRQARGLSLEGLAKLSGADPRALEDLVAGRSFPAVGLLWKLAFALDVPCTDFVEAPRINAAPLPGRSQAAFA